MKQLVQRLFPCQFREPLCLNSWGCRCGKKKVSLLRKLLAVPTGGLSLIGAKKDKGSSKTEQRADDLAKQTEAQATAATALDPQETARRQLAFDLMNQQVPFLESRARLSPEDLFRQTGPTATSLDDLIRSRLGQTGEQLFGGISPAAGDLQRIIQNRLTNFPQISFEDTLRPELDLARQSVSAFANQRGIVGSGLELEQLGRTGVELAIRQARLRQDNALANQQLQQQSIANAQGLVSGQESLLEGARTEAEGLTSASAGLSAQARAELAQQLRDIEQFSQADRSRAVQGQITGQELAQPFQLAGLNALNQREQAAKQRNAMIAAALGSAVLGGVAGGFGALPGLTGASGGGFSLGGFGKGALQSLTGTGAFGSFAGTDIDSLLSRQRQRPFRGAGAGNYPWLSQVYGDVG